MQLARCPPPHRRASLIHFKLHYLRLYELQRCWLPDCMLVPQRLVQPRQLRARPPRARARRRRNQQGALRRACPMVQLGSGCSRWSGCLAWPARRQQHEQAAGQQSVPSGLAQILARRLQSGNSHPRKQRTHDSDIAQTAHTPAPLFAVFAAAPASSSGPAASFFDRSSTMGSLVPGWDERAPGIAPKGDDDGVATMQAPRRCCQLPQSERPAAARCGFAINSACLVRRAS